MELREVLNEMKWQILARLPKGGIYERIKGDLQNPNIDIYDPRYYIYWKDIDRSILKKYLLGLYGTDYKNYVMFFSWLNNYKVGEEYQFLIDDVILRLPVLRTQEDYKCFKTEFLDIIMPYLIGGVDKAQPFLEGPYEYGSVRLKENDVVFDIGANYGLFSALALAKGCWVHAFEPYLPIVNKYTIELKNFYDRFTLNPECVSDKVGDLLFNYDDKVPSRSRITDAKTERTLYLSSTTVDNYVRENNLSGVDFIKSDIEGAERNMLLGARETLREFAPDLAICCYHKLDDPKVLKEIILDANPHYEIVQSFKKIYAHKK